MTPWWTREPKRVLVENGALRGLVARGVLGAYRWECSAGEGVRIQAALALGTREQALEVRLPAHYPRECPSVRPVPYGTRLSAHQFGGEGVLCLEIGPDNWRPDYTAADMLESAQRLLTHETFAAEGSWEIPSRHVTTLGELVRKRPFVLVCPAGLAERVASLPEGGELKACIVAGDGCFQFWPVELPSTDPLPDVPPAFRTRQHTIGRFQRLGPGAPSKPPNDRKQFAEFVMEHGGHQCHETFEFLLLIWQNGAVRGYVVTDDIVTPLVNVPLEEGSDGRLPSRVATLAQSLRVGVVGLGSLGSKVVVSLSRSGVRRFVLVDGDVLLGPNICRHAGRYEQVGMLKAAAAATLIREVTREDAECAVLSTMVASATNPEAHETTLEALGKVDVLVDATANPDVFNALAEVASRGRVPLVWAEVFEGGLGGLVGAAHPLRTPCPQCVRAGFLARATLWPPAPRSNSPRPYETEGDVPLTATDGDVSFVAAALTSRVFEACGADADPAAPVVLFGMRRGWIFERAFDTVSVDVLADDWSCPRCWCEPESLDDEALRQAAAILFAGPTSADDPGRA